MSATLKRAKMNEQEKKEREKLRDGLKEVKTMFSKILWPEGKESSIEESAWWYACNKMLRHILAEAVGNPDDYLFSLPDLFVKYRQNYLKTILTQCNRCQYSSFRNICNYEFGLDVPMKDEPYCCHHFKLDDNDFPGATLSEIIGC